MKDWSALQKASEAAIAKSAEVVERDKDGCRTVWTPEWSAFERLANPAAISELLAENKALRELVMEYRREHLLDIDPCFLWSNADARCRRCKRADELVGLEKWISSEVK